MRFVPLGALLALAPSAPAQTVLLEFDCSGCGPGSAADIAAVGDVTGDGVEDIAIVYALQVPHRTVVRVHSGTDGAIQREWVIPGIASNARLAGGDVDADGWADVVVGMPFEFSAAGQSGVVRVFSGQTSAELLRFDGIPLEFLGHRVASGVDLNGDGHDDVLAVAEGCVDPFVCNPGVLYAFSGDGGGLLFTVVGDGAGALFGYGLAGAGDLDGDGRDDLIVSDSQLGPSVPGDGVVKLIDGDDGSTIREFVNPTGQSFFGRDAAALGDVNGDGVCDFAVTTDVTGPVPARVDVFSGADVSLLWSVTRDASPPNEFFGSAVAGVPDVTGDGVPDVVVGARNGGGKVYLFSGVDGAFENVLEGEPPFERLGAAIGGAPDLDGDGLGEVLAVTRWTASMSNMPGRGRVLSGGALRGPERTCVAAPNSAGPGARFAATGTRSIADDDLGFACASLPPGAFALLVYGAAPAMLAFGDGYLCVSPFAPGLTRRGVRAADSAGFASWEVDLSSPAGPAPGESWTFQVIYRDVAAGASGFNGSDALTATFVP